MPAAAGACAGGREVAAAAVAGAWATVAAIW